MKEMVVLFQNNGCSVKQTSTNTKRYDRSANDTNTRVHTGSNLSSGMALNLCTRRALSGIGRITDYGVFPRFFSAPPEDARTLF
jgi:hypothetical protein